MKNRSIVVALALTFGLFATSCSDDDNEGETIVPLSGKWDIAQVGSVVNGQEVLVDAPQNQAGCEQDFLELKIDNTVNEGNYDSTIAPCTLFTDTGIYSRSNNNLTTVIDGVTKVQDIVNLTLNELKLRDASGAIEVYTR